ncbi:MAG: hypothetical protein JWQ75_2134 [Pseudarthrobacter sp.]|nr:hypothetical protein [Pseudarthrobacter sp.]
MKRALGTIGVAGLALLSVTAPATAADKVIVCHAGGPAGTSYQPIDISTNGLHGHDHHKTDVMPPNRFAADGLNWTTAGQATYALFCPEGLPAAGEGPAGGEPGSGVDPVGEEPAEEQPPAHENPATGEEPADEEPTSEQPPTNEEPDTEEPAEEQPPAQENPTTGEEPTEEQPPAHENPTDGDGQTNENPTEERATAGEAPANEAAPVEQPAANEVRAEQQPAANEGPAQESVTVTAEAAAVPARSSAAAGGGLPDTGTPTVNQGFNAQTAAGGTDIAPGWLGGLGVMLAAGATVAVRRRSRLQTRAD